MNNITQSPLLRAALLLVSTFFSSMSSGSTDVFLSQYMSLVIEQKLWGENNIKNQSDPAYSSAGRHTLVAGEGQLKKMLEQADELQQLTGKSSTIYVSGKQEIHQTLHVNDHELIGVIDTNTGFQLAGFQLDSPVVVTGAYHKIPVSEGLFTLIPDAMAFYPFSSSPPELMGFPVITAAPEFSGGPMVVVSEHSLLDTIAFSHNGCLAEIQIETASRKNPSFADIFHIINPLNGQYTAKGCADSDNTGSRTSVSSGSSEKASHSGSRQGAGAFFRRLFCCCCSGGDGGDDEDEQRRQNTWNRKQKEKKSEPTEEDLDKQLKDIRQSLASLTSERAEIQPEIESHRRECWHLSQCRSMSVGTLPVIGHSVYPSGSVQSLPARNLGQYEGVSGHSRSQDSVPVHFDRLHSIKEEDLSSSQ